MKGRAWVAVTALAVVAFASGALAATVLLIGPLGLRQPSRVTPTPWQSGADFATYSKDRISFRYPIRWRLTTLPDGSINSLLSPDYHDSGGVGITTIQQGGVIGVGQTDIPQPEVTADNYASNPILFPAGTGATDAGVVVINGHKAFQYKTRRPPWWDSTETIFFRVDGTRVDVGISYPTGQDDPHAQEYEQVLASVVIE